MSKKKTWVRRDTKKRCCDCNEKEYLKLLEIDLNEKTQKETYSIIEQSDGLHKIKEALLQAHEIRRFEIQHFWTRSTFFWVFIAFIFTAYCSIMYGYLTSEEKQCHVISLYPKESFLALSSINMVGLTLSFMWYQVVRSSKYWQENWEGHIDMLEASITGHLHKAMLEPEWPILSVSKLCKLLAGISMIVWIVLQFIYSYYFQATLHHCCTFSIYIIVAIAIFIIIYQLTKSTSATK